VLTAQLHLVVHNLSSLPHARVSAAADCHWMALFGRIIGGEILCLLTDILFHLWIDDVSMFCSDYGAV